MIVSRTPEASYRLTSHEKFEPRMHTDFHGSNKYFQKSSVIIRENPWPLSSMRLLVVFCGQSSDWFPAYAGMTIYRIVRH